MRDLKVLRRCLIVALAAGCAGIWPSHFRNHPQATAAIRNSSPHKIHISVTNLEFDSAKQTVEIAIRVFTDDMRNALSRRAKQAAPIDLATAGKDRRGAETMMAYLRSCFELKNRAGRPVVLTWNGIEAQPDPQADMIRIFVKGRMQGGLEGAQIRNKIFCELFDDQVNIVNVKYQGKQIGLMFESKDDFKTLR